MSFCGVNRVAVSRAVVVLAILAVVGNAARTFSRDSHPSTALLRSGSETSGADTTSNGQHFRGAVALSGGDARSADKHAVEGLLGFDGSVPEGFGTVVARGTAALSVDKAAEAAEALPSEQECEELHVNRNARSCPGITGWHDTIQLRVETVGMMCVAKIAQTDGGTCETWCQNAEYVCLRAQDHSDGCQFNPSHTRQTTLDNGCQQTWDSQICQCGQHAVIPAIDLGTASEFAILTKTGVTTTGATSVTGDIGVSPIEANAITGFGLVLDSSNEFSTSSLVVGGGKIYAADYAPPTPAKMTTAISDMETAYTAAAGDNGTPTETELAAGHVDGKTLLGGLYKWSSSVDITTSLTFDAAGNTDTVWIMQIAKSLKMGTGALVTLTNGAQPMNIFWQVAGSTKILAGAHAKGIILCKTAITFGSGASLTGRALAQTAVTMIATTVTAE